MKQTLVVLLILGTLSVQLTWAGSVKADASAFEKNQTVLFVPIAVGGITIIIPTGGGLPPDPGEAGNRTIHGIDSDHDGIRDDVERHISLHFIDNPRARAYSYIIAQKYQKLIENPSMSLSAQRALIVDITEASDCVDKAATNGSEFTMPYVLNTFDRSMAYIDSLQTLKGTILPKSRSCQ